MVRIYFVLFIISSLTLLSSCQKDADNITSDRTESRSYEFTENGCATGKQSFASKDELCAALQNETLNKGCALSLRERYFKGQCPGQVFKPVLPAPPAPTPTPQPAPPTPEPAPPVPAALYPHDTNIVFVRRSKPEVNVCDRIVNRASLSEIARGLMMNGAREGGASEAALDYFRKLEKKNIQINIKLKESKDAQPDSTHYLEVGVSVAPLISREIYGLTISGSQQSINNIQTLLQSETKELLITDDEDCLATNRALNLVRDVQNKGLQWSGQFGFGDRILLPDAMIQQYSYQNQKCVLTQELSLKELSAKTDQQLPLEKIEVGYQPIGRNILRLEFFQNKGSGLTYADSVTLYDFKFDGFNRIEKAVSTLSESGKVLKMTDAKECEDLNQPDGPFYLEKVLFKSN